MSATTSISSILGVLQGGITFTVVLTCTIALIMWQRTKSTHMIFSRMWNVFNGKKECSSPTVSNFFEQQNTIHQFRFVTGIKARTIDNVNGLISWARTNNENITDIAACGDHFNIESPGLRKKPHRRGIIATFVIVLMLSTVVIGSAGGVALQRVILRMNQSGVWFTLDEAYAKPIGDAPGVRLQSCNSDTVSIPNNSGFSGDDLQKICKAFANGSAKDYVRVTVHSQQILFGIIVIFSGYLSFITWGSLMQAVRAREMWKRLGMG
jgi:hypothetical protein